MGRRPKRPFQVSEVGMLGMDTTWSQVSLRMRKLLSELGTIEERGSHTVFRAILLKSLNDPEKLTAPHPFSNLGTR